MSNKLLVLILALILIVSACKPADTEESAQPEQTESAQPELAETPEIPKIVNSCYLYRCHSGNENPEKEIAVNSDDVELDIEGGCHPSETLSVQPGNEPFKKEYKDIEGLPQKCGCWPEGEVVICEWIKQVSTNVESDHTEPPLDREDIVQSYERKPCINNIFGGSFKFAEFKKKYDGVYYSVQDLEEHNPREMTIHTLKIDPKKVELHVTTDKNIETTRKFLEINGMDIAINGGGFDEFNPPYKPNGPAVSDYVPYSRLPGWAVVVYNNGVVSIEEFKGDDVKRLKYYKHVVGGFQVLIDDGYYHTMIDSDVDARTSVGVDSENQVLIIIVVEGDKLARPKRGIRLRELGCLHYSYGATDALNMDGGSSTSLVFREEGVVVPEKEDDIRKVKNHLGIEVINK